MAKSGGTVGGGGRLSGRVAVVTGGGSGIGAASADALAAEGASVVVVDLDGAAAARVAAGVGGMALAADVGRPDDWRRIVAEAAAAFGRVDVAHLNAGVITGATDITELSDDAYRRALGANIDGVVFGVRAVVPAMAAGGGGAVVATASLAGLIAYSPDPIYALTKHAVVGLVRALAPQLAERSVTINAVCPGLVDTPLLDGDMRELLAGSGFPLIDAAEVAAAVVDAATGEASGEAYVIQAGRGPVAFRFARPPGPRTPGAEGRLPPPGLAAHDQG